MTAAEVLREAIVATAARQSELIGQYYVPLQERLDRPLTEERIKSVRERLDETKVTMRMLWGLYLEAVKP